jgi:hypothetical protein
MSPSSFVHNKHSQLHQFYKTLNTTLNSLSFQVPSMIAYPVRTLLLSHNSLKTLWSVTSTAFNTDVSCGGAEGGSGIMKSKAGARSSSFIKVKSSDHDHQHNYRKRKLEFNYVNEVFNAGLSQFISLTTLTLANNQV